VALALAVVSGIAVAAWLYLLVFHGGFWRADMRLGRAPPPAAWPRIVAAIPARDEAETIGRAVASLFAQAYPGRLDIVVVDDASTDGTADIARRAAHEAGAGERLTVVATPPLPEGWVGKMWAVATGLARVPADARYVLLTDADIVHAPDALARLVAKAEAEGRALVSLMVRLSTANAAERLLIPAFVFFFQKLYPFRRVADPGSRIAGAAGGCMLVRRDALDASGGIAPIRDALIDDCALARRLKALGPIWLGLADNSRSLRAYAGLGDIWRMVARTAYTQLGYSPALLAGTVLGMALLYLAPPLALALGLAFQAWTAAALGALGWIAMSVAYAPTLRYHGLGLWRAPLLALAGLLYTAMTVDSARRHALGKGGAWKGRSYDRATLGRR
jgi:hopene-associated glycosyltransferase HpnB